MHINRIVDLNFNRCNIFFPVTTVSYSIRQNYFFHFVSVSLRVPNLLLKDGLPINCCSLQVQHTRMFIMLNQCCFVQVCISEGMPVKRIRPILETIPPCQMIKICCSIIIGNDHLINHKYVRNQNNIQSKYGL